MNTTGRIRRVRRVSNNTSGSNERMLELLQSIADKQKATAVLAAEIAEAERELFTLMQSNKVMDLSIDDATAVITRPTGRSSSYIDPMDFRKVVNSDKDFYYAVTVSITKAREVLSRRALNKVMVITECKDGEPKLVVKRR